jgi:hypothetical protein
MNEILENQKKITLKDNDESCQARILVARLGELV